MAATTIADLPRDALVLILRAVLDSPKRDAHPYARAQEIHKILRRVCREWREAADIAFIEYEENHAFLCLPVLRNPETVRARFPSMIHKLTIQCQHSPGFDACTAPTAALALSSLCASPDLRRVLKNAHLYSMCCVDEAAAAVSEIVACSHLTSLQLEWWRHVRPDRAQPDMLAPLSQLTGLEYLSMSGNAALPALPDCASLASLELQLWNGTLAPMGSDASLGRLRSLSLSNIVNIKGHSGGWASDDPLRLRAALSAGTWRPHLLTRLQDLRISISCYANKEFLHPVDEVVDAADDDDADGWEPRVYFGAMHAAAMWAPLAPTVTKLELFCESSMYHDSDLETGMYAGLGELTRLQTLIVRGHSLGQRFPVDFDSVHCPRLTCLNVDGYRGPSIDLTRFPLLVSVKVGAKGPASPVALESVAALRRLESLCVSGRQKVIESAHDPLKPRLNLAQLFGGGRRVAALTALSFDHVMLTWDAAAAPGAPTAPEFVAHAGALLPSLRSFEITEYVDMDEGVREFVTNSRTPTTRALARDVWVRERVKH